MTNGTGCEGGIQAPRGDCRLCTIEPGIQAGLFCTYRHLFWNVPAQPSFPSSRTGRTTTTSSCHGIYSQVASPSAVQPGALPQGRSYKVTGCFLVTSLFPCAQRTLLFVPTELRVYSRSKNSLPDLNLSVFSIVSPRLYGPWCEIDLAVSMKTRNER